MPSVDYIILIFFVILGVIMIITNKPMFYGTSRYTEESLKKYPRPAGLANIIFGLSGIAFFYTLRLFFQERISGWLTLACLVVFIGSIITTIIITKKTLIKK